MISPASHAGTHLSMGIANSENSDNHSICFRHNHIRRAKLADTDKITDGVPSVTKFRQIH